jgi:hypothetical protein
MHRSSTAHYGASDTLSRVPVALTSRAPASCPLSETARNLVITSGKNMGERPSVATTFRICGEDTDSIE